MKIGYPDTKNKKQTELPSPLACWSFQSEDSSKPCYSPPEKKSKDDSKKEVKKSRRYVETLGDQNFRSERRLPGFAEDTSKTNIQKDAERRNKETLNPKPKAEVLKRKKKNK